MDVANDGRSRASHGRSSCPVSGDTAPELQEEAGTEGAQPNLLFVFPDQFRAQALGFCGEDPVSTPSLDRFARESRVCTQAVSNQPICSPFRAMLMTGKYPFSTGVTTNCHSGVIPYGVELKADEPCLTDVLAAAGYDVGYVGKWHLDLPRADHAPFTEGWRDEFGMRELWDAYTPPGPRRHGVRFWHSYGCCDWHLHPHYWEGAARVEERLDVRGWSVEHETDTAIRFLADRTGSLRRRDRPFALFVSYNPPHTPYEQVPGRYREPYAGRDAAELLVRPNARCEGQGRRAWEAAVDYFAAVTGVDAQFGRLVAALDRENLSDDTIVVFTSDHGELMGSHGLMYKNWWYEECLRIPLLVRWPRHVPVGEDSTLIGAADLMPSLLGLMGLGASTPAGVQGRDVSGAFRGHPVPGADSTPYLFIDAARPSTGRRGVRTAQYTYVIDRLENQSAEWMFDNREDPYQMRNIAPEQRRLADELKEETQRWQTLMGDPWPRT